MREMRVFEGWKREFEIEKKEGCNGVYIESNGAGKV